MPGLYDHAPLRFQYPENWEIIDEDSQNWPHTVTVQSPDGSFWSLYAYPLSRASEGLVEDALQSLRAEYPELEATAVSELLDDVELTGFDVYFYCLDFLITAQIRCGKVGNYLYLMMAQAEDREFGRIGVVFRAMLTSLIMSAQENPH